MWYINLWIGVDVNFDKVCLILRKTMLSLWYWQILEGKTTGFQPWPQYRQNDYATLRYRKMLIMYSSAPKMNWYLAAISLKYSASYAGNVSIWWRHHACLHLFRISSAGISLLSYILLYHDCRLRNWYISPLCIWFQHRASLDTLSSDTMLLK